MANLHTGNITTISLLALVTLFGIPITALSQDDAAPDDPPIEASQNPEMERKLAEMEKQMQQMDKEFKAEIKRIETEAAEHKKNTIESENFSIEAAEEFDTTRLLSIYGFFDVNFIKHFQSDDAVGNLFVPAKSSFLISNINVYLLSQMTETLTAMLELRFSFQPHGQENELETIVLIDGQEISREGEYDRVDTTVTDPFDSLMYKQGGISIERVHLTYAPFEWLNVLVGRYLTPYGIWNIDHGSPVVLPVQLPFMYMREMVPQAQTGLQVMGRLFATDTVFFDYAVTLSNGRGDLDAIYDVNENKAVGLRMRLSYEGEKLRLSAGGYGFYGVSSKTEKVVEMHMRSDMTLDMSLDRPMRVVINDTGTRDDYILSADFLLEIAGIELQSEYVWNRMNVQTHSIEEPEWAVAKGGSPLDTSYYASSVGNAVYVLLGYELPLYEWIAPVRITPYLLYEYTEYSDTAPHGNIDLYRGGLNVKPSPYVVLKVEFVYGVPHNKIYGETNKALLGQAAVSF